MNILKLFSQPEYIHRPRQILTRLRRVLQPLDGEPKDVKMPWGATLRVRPGEYIGSIIWHRGVFDLIVLETIARLLEPAELALDIGSNIGQMSTLMSCKVGRE